VKSNKNRYDVAIIGAGTAGIFAAYELHKMNPDLNVVIIEQGNNINDRKCPIVESKRKGCIGCKSCSIMRGFGGAGAFSDGKFNLTTEFGGWLTDYIPAEDVMDLIYYVDKINVEFGAVKEVFSTNTDEAKKIEKKALENDLHLLHAVVKHLGTENNFSILSGLYEYLKEHIEEVQYCSK
jgi:uncharacterized FAD-dependent dehydrogenase